MSVVRAFRVIQGPTSYDDRQKELDDAPDHAVDHWCLEIGVVWDSDQVGTMALWLGSFNEAYEMEQKILNSFEPVEIKGVYPIG